MDALKTAGCRDADIYADKASGVRGNRPGLDACVEVLEPGDTLVVWRLDRLGRSMPHLVSLVEGLLGKGIGFRSKSDGAIDTTTASGELMFNIFSSLAQFGRRLIQERTQSGLAAARARGRKGGRRPIPADHPRVLTAKSLHKDRGLSINHICETLGISRPTFYRYLALYLTPLQKPQRWRPRWCNFRFKGLPRPVLRGYRYVEVSDLGVARRIITGKRQHNDSDRYLLEEERWFIPRLEKRVCDPP